MQCNIIFFFIFAVLLKNPPIIKSKPAPSDTAAITVTAGAATTVDRNITLTVFNPMKETPRTPSAACYGKNLSIDDDEVRVLGCSDEF